MADRNSLTAARLRDLLDYDPLTGVFTRRVTRGNQAKGSVAGHLSATDGYCYVDVDRKKYRAHRLAWFYVHGAWPAQDIDHRDTVKSHNWISNLRPADDSLNKQNMRVARADNRLGVLGVTQVGDKFRAKIFYGGKSHNLGRHVTAELASVAYWAAKREHHEGNTL